MKTSNVLPRVFGVTAALIGVLFFFIVVGVFGLPLAIAGWPYSYSGCCCLPRIPNRGVGAMKLDPSILARIQFAFTVSFHIIFPTMSIGLASFLAVMKALWLKTKNPTYLQIYRFWLNIFAMASGLCCHRDCAFVRVWSRIRSLLTDGWASHWPLIALEVLTAFFLEAGFLESCSWSSSRRPKAALFRNLHGGGRLRFYRLRGYFPRTVGCRHRLESQFMMVN